MPDSEEASAPPHAAPPTGMRTPPSGLAFAIQQFSIIGNSLPVKDLCLANAEFRCCIDCKVAAWRELWLSGRRDSESPEREVLLLPCRRAAIRTLCCAPHVNASGSLGYWLDRRHRDVLQLEWDLDLARTDGDAVAYAPNIDHPTRLSVAFDGVCRQGVGVLRGEVQQALYIIRVKHLRFYDGKVARSREIQPLHRPTRCPDFGMVPDVIAGHRRR